jgi:Predicted nucleoside-diphosphate sugar epimerases
MATVTLPIVIAARYLAFIPFGLYRSIWRYAGSRDLLAIVSAVAVSEVSRSVHRRDTHVRRLLARVLHRRRADLRGRDRRVPLRRAGARAGVRTYRDRTGRRTLIVGAGRTGRSLQRELRETAGERVLGFIDDNPRLRRRRVQGVSVLGGTHELERLLERLSPDVVLVTIPDAPRERLDAIVAACAGAEVDCKFVRREIDLDPRVVLNTVGDAE